jgi:hypothetical protein
MSLYKFLSRAATVTPTQPVNIPSITIEDINAACECLVALKLPREIAGTVLDYAEYWCVQRFTRKAPVKLIFVSNEEPEVATMYLQTDPIGQGGAFDELDVLKPRRIVFRTVSGIGDAPGTSEYNYVGPGKCRTSWFDISVVREDESYAGDGSRQEPIYTLLKKSPDDTVFVDNGRDNYVFCGTSIEDITDDEDMNESNDRAFFYWWRGHPDPKNEDFDILPLWMYRDERKDRSKIEGGFKVVPNGTKQRWLLQENKCDSYEVMEHVVTWTTEEVRDEEFPEDGAGKGSNFVTSLKRGDRIAVWARSDVSLIP